MEVETDEKKACWSCGSRMDLSETLCPSCDRIQPYPKGTDYFAAMGLRRLLKIDLKDLEGRFYHLSRRFHPDFHHQKDKVEQDISLDNSALLNRAYRTLKDPFSRVEYLVLLEQGEKEITAQVPKEFLEEVFELQETLDEFKSAKDPAARERLQASLKESMGMLEGRLADLEAGLFAMFGEWDGIISESQRPAGKDERHSLLQRMRESLSYRTYYKNLILDIEHLLQGNVDRRPIRH